MIRPLAVPRWAISFADLSLLLLGFFVMLQAGSAQQVAAGARAAFSSEPLHGPLLDMRATDLFEAGEARLTPAGLIQVGSIAVRASGQLVIESEGRDVGTTRFDGWELSAARAAALARALKEAGIAEERVTIRLGGSVSQVARGQRLIVRGS